MRAPPPPLAQIAAIHSRSPHAALLPSSHAACSRLSSRTSARHSRLAGVSHFFWITHFLSHYHQLTQVLCFLLFAVWLVPFGFFISLSVNESTLPDRLASSADEMYSDGGARSRKRSGILAAFGFFQQQRDGMVPAFGKKV